MSWVMDLEATFFTIIKNNFPDRLKTKYQDAFFTMESQVNTDPQFPTIYVHMLPMSEQGGDLVNQSINGVRATIQVDVTTNVSYAECNEVMSAILDEVKELGFKVTALPEAFIDVDVYRQTMQAERVIGNGDKIIN